MVAAFRDLELKSHFVGYELEQVETRILAIEPVPEAEGEVYVVLAENPFYATGGGQVPGEAWITSDRGQREVFESFSAGNYHAPLARTECSTFEVGEAATASTN